MTHRCDWCGEGIYGNVFGCLGERYWHTSCYATFLFYLEHNALDEYERKKREYFDKIDKRLESL